VGLSGDAEVELYKDGYELEVEVKDESVLNRLSQERKIHSSLILPKAFENQYYILKHGSLSIPVLIKNQEALIIKDLDSQDIYSHNRNFTPKDVRQKIALKYLNDDATQCVVILGKAGTAKTFLTLSYAMKALNNNKYQKVFLVKPVIPVMQSEYLGTLPGDLEAKIGPFMESFYDAIQSLNLTRNFESYLEMGSVEFQPISYIRGRHLENSLVVVDEAQNLTPESLIAVATRISAIGSKLVLLLDPNTIQKDHKWDSGVSRLLNDPFMRIYSSPHFGVIHLIKRMRSHIGAIIEDVLLEEPQQ
jgi:predicted ribonuclease YlaK